MYRTPEKEKDRRRCGGCGRRTGPALIERRKRRFMAVSITRVFWEKG